MSDSSQDITGMGRLPELDAVQEETLFKWVEQRFRQMAKRLLRREPYDPTVQETGLVNDTFLKLVRGRNTSWNSSREFYALAARAMGLKLVDYARKRLAAKRGAGAITARLDAVAHPHSPDLDPADVLAIHEALENLKADHPDPYAVFHPHWYLGFTLAEIADVLDVSISTVTTDLRFAKAILRRNLDET